MKISFNRLYSLLFILIGTMISGVAFADDEILGSYSAIYRHSKPTPIASEKPQEEIPAKYLEEKSTKPTFVHGSVGMLPQRVTLPENERVNYPSDYQPSVLGDSPNESEQRQRGLSRPFPSFPYGH